MAVMLFQLHVSSFVHQELHRKENLLHAWHIHYLKQMVSQVPVKKI